MSGYLEGYASCVFAYQYNPFMKDEEVSLSLSDVLVFLY